MLSEFCSTDHAAGVVGHDEVGLDVVVLQIGVAQASVARLHLVVIAQAAQSLLGDMDASVEQTDLSAGTLRQSKETHSLPL